MTTIPAPTPAEPDALAEPIEPDDPTDPTEPDIDAAGAAGPGAAKVLFVCVGNSCRSQMAEGFARHHGLAAESAGTEPASAVSRTAMEVMAEKGIDLTAHTPKTLDWTRLLEFDRTITMGCGVAESCPALRTDEDWGLDDPVGQPIEVFRAVRDDIEKRVLGLKAALDGSK